MPFQKWSAVSIEGIMFLYQVLAEEAKLFALRHKDFGVLSQKLVEGRSTCFRRTDNEEVRLSHDGGCTG